MRAARSSGFAFTLALHGAVLAALLAWQPARTAVLAAAPIMVDWIAAPRPLPMIAPPRPETPKPVEHHRPKPRPVEKPKLLTAAQEEPAAAPKLAPAPRPAPPPAPVALATPPAAAAPVVVTQPIFNADYLQNPAPPYPTLSRRIGEQGRVVLRVLVSPQGRADQVELRSSSGSARLDASARETVSHWKFVPAKRGSEPVAEWVLVPISFKLDS